MRGPRLRNDSEKSYLHCFNRTAGWSGDQIFGDVDKEHLFRLAENLQKFYSVEIISFVCMSNHWHALVCTYPDLPDRDEVKRRYRAFYGADWGEPNWNDPAVVEKYARRMRDVSCFVKDLQQRFTCWFNRQYQRRGRLWADRYKSVLLEGGHALWECLKYLEMNPVRAGACADPADYRFCSWGRYCGSGKHPFAEAFEKHLVSYHALEEEQAGDDAMGFEEVATLLSAELARVTAYERGEKPEDIEVAEKKARQILPFELRVTRRVRYWSDGAIIGSKAFVQRMASDFFGKEYVDKKRLKLSSPPAGAGDAGGSLVSLRQLQHGLK